MQNNGRDGRCTNAASLAGRKDEHEPAGYERDKEPSVVCPSAAGRRRGSTAHPRRGADSARCRAVHGRTCGLLMTAIGYRLPQPITALSAVIASAQLHFARVRLRQKFAPTKLAPQNILG